MEIYQRRPAMTRSQHRQRKFLEQRMIGLVLLMISAVLAWMFWANNEDCGAVFLIAPLGLFLLFSKRIWIA